MKIQIKKLKESAKLPTYAHATDAGADLYSAEDITIPAGQRVLVSTGVAMAIPDGYAGLIWDKSGISAKSGVTTMAGVIDSGYRGEIKVLLYNSSNEDYKVRAGDKIAQMLFQKVEQGEFEDVQELPDADRGDAGFGSTGIR